MDNDGVYPRFADAPVTAREAELAEERDRLQARLSTATAHIDELREQRDEARAAAFRLAGQPPMIIGSEPRPGGGTERPGRTGATQRRAARRRV